MDPTANLKEQLRNAQDIRKVWEEDCNDDGTLPAHRAQYVAQQADRLAELVEALNEWITKGGFLPEQWSNR